MSDSRQIMGQNGQVHLSDFPVTLFQGLTETARRTMARRWYLSLVLMGVIRRSEQREAGPECLGGIADFDGVSPAQLHQTTVMQPWDSTSQLKKVQGSPQGSCEMTSFQLSSHQQQRKATSRDCLVARGVNSLQWTGL